MGIKKRRIFEDTISKQMWDGKRFASCGRYTTKTLRPGLKKVNISQDVWLIGKSSRIKDGRLHQVIYGPDNKEYHLYDRDVEYVNFVPDDEFHQANDYYHNGPNTSYINRHGNTSYEPRVKIYILTRILDNKDNWCFDLNNKPIVGSKVKVIYDNGMIRWVDYFSGEFEKTELISKRSFWFHGVYGSELRKEPVSQTFVNPVAYRK